MRLLVTGGAGFIGSNFVRRSLRGFYPRLGVDQITVLDKLTYAGSTENLAEVWDTPRLTFVHGDIRDTDVVRDLMGGVSAVVHFAAESHVDRSIEDGRSAVETNVVGTQTLVEEARRAGIGRFLLVSTDEVYGEIEHGAWTEDCPLRPNSPYSATKAAAEHLVSAAVWTHGLPAIIVRASNTYGPYQHPEKLIPRFITNLLSGRSVPLYGDGENVREWMHVDDHCDGLALILRHGRPGEVYNLGSGFRVTNRDVTECLLRLTGTGWASVHWVPDRKGHDTRYSLDTTRIRNELGFTTRVSLERGIAETVEWYARRSAWVDRMERRLARTT